MSRACTLLCSRQRPAIVLTLIVGLIALIAHHPSYAASQPIESPTTLAASAMGVQHEGVLIAADGALSLSPAALPSPLANQPAARYGFYLAPAQHLESPTLRVALSYDAHLPAGSRVGVDMRGSADGERWTAWETDLKNGAIVTLPNAVRVVQYRARLMSSSTQTGPTLRSVLLEPQAAPSYHALDTSSEAVAPTFTIHATRLGMVGGRTANGHIITPRDRFVALPSWRSLSSRGGHEYQVRITYRGKSVVAPVWDVGPWNTRDNYWDHTRERYHGLPRGWPQDHAAYFDGHNGGYAEKGYVRFPTAMDVGDGVWWELGIPGDRGEVEVTFLWLGHDPLETPPPPPDPNAREFLVSEQNRFAFTSEAALSWYHSPAGCGEGKHALWTLSAAEEAQRENQARWQPELPRESLYDVYVHVPICPNERPPATRAHYVVTHRDGTEEVVVNQAKHTGWVLLGRFPFGVGKEGTVALDDVTGEEGRAVWFDDARWVVVDEKEEAAQADAEVLPTPTRSIPPPADVAPAGAQPTQPTMPPVEPAEANDAVFPLTGGAWGGQQPVFLPTTPVVLPPALTKRP